jgi:hypothetical protein
MRRRRLENRRSGMAPGHAAKYFVAQPTSIYGSYLFVGPKLLGRNLSVICS